MSFFSFPENVRWNADNECVEFGVAIGLYEGVVRVQRVVFRRVLGLAVTPEQCLETYHAYRTEIELAVEAKLCRRELAPDGNVDLTSRDLRRQIKAQS